MVMKCPVDQNDLIENFCEKCNRLFFDARDLISIEIDQEAIIRDFPNVGKDEDTRRSMLEDTIDAIRDQFRKLESADAYVHGSPYVKITRFVVTDIEYKTRHEIADRLQVLFDRGCSAYEAPMDDIWPNLKMFIEDLRKP